jgi:hypothetical protein
MGEEYFKNQLFSENINFLTLYVDYFFPTSFASGTLSHSENF